ncbi:MAG: parallel beta-helix domain-containing protein [Chitinophagaceae bacterium]
MTAINKRPNGPQGKNYLASGLTWMIFIILFSFTSCQKQSLQPSMEKMQLEHHNIQDQLENKTLVVHAGESIQAALNAAAPGTLIRIEPGIYKEALTVHQTGIHLEGQGSDESGQVVLENPGNQPDGIIVQQGSNGFFLENITIRGFQQNGVVLDSLDDFSLLKVSVFQDGDYGIITHYSKGGTIQQCSASGNKNSGIYIAQSSDIQVMDNQAFSNVKGLESENSSSVFFMGNTCFNNCSGILVVLLPDLGKEASSGVVVDNNQVADNNLVNFSPPGDPGRLTPSGVGILVLGTAHTTLSRNRIFKNNFEGIAVASSLIMIPLAHLPFAAFSGFSPAPTYLMVKGNVLEKNGLFPPPFPLPLPGEDLFWDGSGQHNVWEHNIFKTSYPNPLPD